MVIIEVRTKDNNEYTSIEDDIVVREDQVWVYEYTKENDSRTISEKDKTSFQKVLVFPQDVKSVSVRFSKQDNE